MSYTADPLDDPNDPTNVADNRDDQSYAFDHAAIDAAVNNAGIASEGDGYAGGLGDGRSRVSDVFPLDSTQTIDPANPGEHAVPTSAAAQAIGDARAGNPPGRALIETSGFPGGAGPTPGSIMQQQTAPGLGDPTTAPGATDPYSIMANALASAPATPPGQTGRPLTVEEKAFQDANPNGGSFTNPQAGVSVPGNGRPLTVEEQAFQAAHPNGGSFPNLPAGGTGAVQPSGLPGGAAPGGALSDQQWEDQFKKDNGFFDPRFNSREAMLANAQRGDSVIRDQLAAMGKYDSDARLVSGAIGGLPDFYQSQNAANWDAQHAAQIQGRIQAGEFKGNQAALANIEGQVVAPPANPIANERALLTSPQHQTLMDTLTAMGATVNHPLTFDPGGNLSIGYLDRSGTQQYITATLPNIEQKIAQLQQFGGGAQSPAPPSQPPASNAPPRNTGFPPRGNGGYTPPAAPPTPAASGQFAYPNVGGQSSLAVNDPAFQNQGRAQPALVTPQIATMRNDGRPVPY